MLLFVVFIVSASLLLFLLWMELLMMMYIICCMCLSSACYYYYYGYYYYYLVVDGIFLVVIFVVPLCFCCSPSTATNILPVFVNIVVVLCSHLCSNRCCITRYHHGLLIISTTKDAWIGFSSSYVRPAAAAV